MAYHIGVTSIRRAAVKKKSKTLAASDLLLMKFFQLAVRDSSLGKP
jgi:hypothetical protein